jgi:pimeloyl-ACP methyl ester carboxylesterase
LDAAGDYKGIEALRQKRREAGAWLPEALEAISLTKNLSARKSLPTETQNPDEKLIPAGGCNRTPGTPMPPSGVVVEECWLDLPDGRMRYLKAGSGPPLILVHGLMGYSFSWRFTIPALSSHATVYAIDNLGAGLSPAHDGINDTVRATAERVLQFANALGIEHFDLLGTSHGGAVAIMVAAICEERRHERRAEQKDSRLKRLILVASVNPWSSHGRRLAPFIGSAFGTWIFRNTFVRWPSLHDVGLRRMFGDASKIPPDSLHGYRIPIVENHAFDHGLRIVRNWTADLAQMERALPTIRDYPTLLMWGTKDSAVYFSSAEPLRRNFRNVRLVAFEGVGHLPYEEAPEEFNRALIEFLTRA